MQVLGGALHELVGTSLRMSGSNHPETDGVSEQKVKVTSQALRILASDNAETWSYPSVLCRVCAEPWQWARATGLSAFEASTGWQPCPWPMGDGSVLRGTGSGMGMVGQERRRTHLRVTRLLVLGSAWQRRPDKHHLPDPAEVHPLATEVYVDTKGLAFPASMTRDSSHGSSGPFPITAAFPASSNY